MKRLLALHALFLMAACSDTAAPAPDADDVLTEDIAFSSAAAVTGDVVGGVDGDAATLGQPGRLGGPPRAFDRANCPYVPETGWHECTMQSPGGMSITHAYAFLTDDGTPQERFDPVTTESIRSRMSRSGTMITPRLELTIDHERSTTVSGLAGAETRHILNGTGTRDDLRRSREDGVRRSGTLTSRDTITDVVRLLPAAEHPWPASGTIVHNIAATQTVEGDRTVTRSRSRRVVVTFNGTSLVPMTVGDRQFTLDLATGRVVRR